MFVARPTAISEQARKFRDRSIGSSVLPLIGLMARVAGWRPDEFWAATPADVRAVLAAWAQDDADASFDGAALAAMMERFPDG